MFRGKRCFLYTAGEMAFDISSVYLRSPFCAAHSELALKSLECGILMCDKKSSPYLIAW